MEIHKNDGLVVKYGSDTRNRRLSRKTLLRLEAAGLTLVGLAAVYTASSAFNVHSVTGIYTLVIGSGLVLGAASNIWNAGNGVRKEDFHG